MARNYKTKEEREHIAFVKGMECLVCNAPPQSEYHHICDCGRRIGEFFGLPLCQEDHRGNSGFSGTGYNAWDKGIINQIELLVKVFERKKQPMPDLPPFKVRRVWHDHYNALKEKHDSDYLPIQAA